MLPSRCITLPCMKIAVRSVSQTGIGVFRRPGSATSTAPWGVFTTRICGSVSMSCPEMISAGTCT